MNRREFLYLMLACGMVPLTTANLRSCEGCLPWGRGGGNTPGVWAWLRMFETSGDYGIPTSEAEYTENLDRIYAALPLNGGKLQADGTWQQESWKTDSAWARNLPATARKAGQLYMPGVGNDRQGIVAVLQSPPLQEAAANSLVELAVEDRHDAPWDGVYLDLEGIPYEYGAQLSDFLVLLAQHIKDAGLRVGISVRGRTGDSGSDPPDAYTYDFGVVGEIADYVDLRCYNYWAPPPRSIAPFWWIEECIQYALRYGISERQLTLGLGTFSEYRFDVNEAHSDEITYAHAMETVAAHGAASMWVEENENGIVREYLAEVGSGTIWIHDARTHGLCLQLVNQFDLLGTTLFAPGMSDPAIWAVIEAWLRPQPHFLPWISAIV